MSKEAKKVVHLPSETVKRLIRDVKNIKKNPLSSDGIYYVHDEDNLLKGYALIIGPKDTVYQDGYYFFDIDYPFDYPHSPPKISFKTNRDRVRFNPNLYVNGKVCLSILNTWKGEQWTSCQTITSTLLTICTIFTNEPLLNEPGIGRSHRDFSSYNEIIRYKNIEVAILSIINRDETIYLPMFDKFRDVVENHFLKNYKSTKLRVDEYQTISKKRKVYYFQTHLYGMNFKIDYSILKPQLVSTKNKIETRKIDDTDKSENTGICASNSKN